MTTEIARAEMRVTLVGHSRGQTTIKLEPVATEPLHVGSLDVVVDPAASQEFKRGDMLTMSIARTRAG